MVLGNLKGLIDLNDKEIATLRLTASLAMTGTFRQPEKLLSLRALTKLMRGNPLTTENRFNGFRQPERFN